jgi:hypothetical protein
LNHLTKSGIDTADMIMTFYGYDSDDHERQATALLAELGKFVVSFERVCAGMRACIECALWRAGGKRDDAHCTQWEDLVHGKTAGHLRSTLKSQYMQLVDQDISTMKTPRKNFSRLLLPIREKMENQFYRKSA